MRCTYDRGAWAALALASALASVWWLPLACSDGGSVSPPDARSRDRGADRGADLRGGGDGAASDLSALDAGLLPDEGAFVCKPAAQPGELWELSAENLRTVSLCEFRGQVVLIVNIAAKCGYTPQLGGLAAMHEQYRAQGFTVLGFYSNQFLQAGSQAEQDACEASYGVTFPTFYDVSVNPPDEHPVFTWLKAQPGFAGAVLWNFEKFLIDRGGQLVARWATAVQPQDAALVQKVEATIAQPRP